MFFTTALLTIIGFTSVNAASIPKLENRDDTNTTSLTFFNGTCTSENVSIRKEWRNLTSSEKTAYLAAENCLMTLPAQTNLSGVVDRFSDLQAVHRSKTNQTVDGIFVGDIVHKTGQFLPWHRFFIHTHEVLLRTECNYEGPMTWWDETKDADSGNFFQSEMWNADAFGSNGTGWDNCVADGAFANYTEHIGPGLQNTRDGFCLRRNWEPSLGYLGATSEVIAEVMSAKNFEEYDYKNYNFPHSYGHIAVGGYYTNSSKDGMMSDLDSSPGDPMFYLHHGFIDRLWWQWQQSNASYGLTAIGGNAYNVTYLDEEDIVLPVSVPQTITLDTQLTVYDILPSLPISEVMNIQGGYLCYEYDY